MMYNRLFVFEQERQLTGTKELYFGGFQPVVATFSAFFRWQTVCLIRSDW